MAARSHRRQADDMNPKNPLWALIQEHMDSERYGPRSADIARVSGVSEQVLSKWKRTPTLPLPTQLAKVSRGTGIPYADLLIAALAGKGYLPKDTRFQAPGPQEWVFLHLALAEEQVAAEQAAELVAARDIGRLSRGQQQRDELDLVGEPPADDPDDMEPR